MKLRHALRSLILFTCLLPGASAFSRGGETGTLDEAPIPGVSTTTEAPLMPVGGRWAPYYMRWDQFRRLRMRLAGVPLAPVPGWEGQRAWKFDDRYFTEDGVYELFPLMFDKIH